MPPCYLNVTSNISIDAKISTHMCKPLSKFHNVVTWISIIIELHKELTNFSESLGRYFWCRGQGKCQLWDYFESVMGSGGSILYVLSPPPGPSTGK